MKFWKIYDIKGENLTNLQSGLMRAAWWKRLLISIINRCENLCVAAFFSLETCKAKLKFRISYKFASFLLGL